jgi:hypothetical protein
MKIRLSLSREGRKAFEPFGNLIQAEGPDSQGQFAYSYVIRSILKMPPRQFESFIVGCEIFDEFALEPIRCHGIYTGDDSSVFKTTKAVVDEVVRGGFLRRSIYVQAIGSTDRGTGICLYHDALSLYVDIRAGRKNPDDQHHWSGSQ